MTDRIHSRVHKEVRFTFRSRGGEANLSFFLSMGLFSSFEVDAGTRLLLKQIDSEVDFSRLNRVLDAGCGTGVLGISLRKAYAHLELTALDRDALALSITQLNAAINDLPVKTVSGLDMLIADTTKDSETLFTETGHFDLIATNIPAKAGEPVLRRFFLNASALLEEQGYFAVVIVSPLRKIAEMLIVETGLVSISVHHTDQYSVFIGKKREQSVLDTSFPGPYARKKNIPFFFKKKSWIMDTVYDIAGFDTLPYEVDCAVSLLSATKWNPAEKVLFWNPGQGHLPMAYLTLAAEKETPLPECVIAGRDLLSLLISQYNVKKRFPEIQCRIIHSAGIDMLPAEISVDFALILPDTVPRVKFSLMLAPALPDLFRDQEKLLIAGKSGEISLLTKEVKQLSQIASKKGKGYRAVLLRNK